MKRYVLLPDMNHTAVTSIAIVIQQFSIKCCINLSALQAALKELGNRSLVLFASDPLDLAVHVEFGPAFRRFESLRYFMPCLSSRMEIVFDLCRCSSELLAWLALMLAHLAIFELEGLLGTWPGEGRLVARMQEQCCGCPWKLAGWKKLWGCANVPLDNDVDIIKWSCALLEFM